MIYNVAFWYLFLFGKPVSNREFYGFYIKKTDATAVEPNVSKTRPRTSDRGGYYFGTSEEDSARPQSEARRPWLNFQHDPAALVCSIRRVSRRLDHLKGTSVPRMACAFYYLFLFVYSP